MICSEKLLSWMINWILNGEMGSVKSLLTFPVHDLKILWDLGGFNAAISLNFFPPPDPPPQTNVERNIPGMGENHRRSCVLKCRTLLSGLVGDESSALTSTAAH